MGGDRRAGARDKRGGIEGGRRDGGNREKLRKFRNILLYFVIEMGQRGENHNGKGREAGLKVTGRGSRRYGKREFQTQPVPPHILYGKIYILYEKYLKDNKHSSLHLT